MQQVDLPKKKRKKKKMKREEIRHRELQLGRFWLKPFGLKFFIEKSEVFSTYSLIVWGRYLRYKLYI